MPSQIMRHLATSGGMTNVHGVLHIKMRDQSRKVVGIVIHVMAVARLGGPAVASPVMGDDAIALFEEEQHLRVPVIGRERPAMTENYGLSLAPILIIDVDAGSVFFSDSYVWHCNFPFLLGFIAACRVLSPIKTKCAARFHRSKLRSDSLWQRHDAPRIRCAPREGASPAFCCRPPTQRSCPGVRRIPHHYRARAEDGRFGRST